MNSSDKTLVIMLAMVFFTVITIAICITGYQMSLNKWALERGMVQGSIPGIAGVHWVSPSNSVLTSTKSF